MRFWLIDGARQTGKTYLLQTLLGSYFNKVVRVDFLESPDIAQAFAGSLSPNDIIMGIELITDEAFNSDTDLLILDEIGECQRAVTSLKYFAEQATEATHLVYPLYYCEHAIRQHILE